MINTRFGEEYSHYALVVFDEVIRQRELVLKNTFDFIEQGPEAGELNMRCQYEECLKKFSYILWSDSNDGKVGYLIWAAHIALGLGKNTKGFKCPERPKVEEKTDRETYTNPFDQFLD